jgi:hypothetical protein
MRRGLRVKGSNFLHVEEAENALVRDVLRRRYSWKGETGGDVHARLVPVFEIDRV